MPCCQPILASSQMVSKAWKVEGMTEQGVLMLASLESPFSTQRPGRELKPPVDLRRYRSEHFCVVEEGGVTASCGVEEVQGLKLFFLEGVHMWKTKDETR